MRLMLIILVLVLGNHACASDLVDATNNRVKSYYLAPTSSPDTLVVVVRDANYIYSFLSQRLSDGQWVKDMSEMSDIPFEKDRPSYLGLIPSDNGCLTIKDNPENFSKELAKFGLIKKEFDGPAKIKLSVLESIFVRYATNYPKFIEWPN